MRRELAKTPAPVDRGDELEVREPGIRPWTGIVRSVKWSSVSGWWADVDAGFGRTIVLALEGDTEWRKAQS